MNSISLSEYNVGYVSYPANRTPKNLFSLRYSCYQQEGIINKRDDRLFIDKYDDDNSAFNCGVTVNNKLVSAIRISFLSKDNCVSPSYDTFSDILDPYINDGCTMVDPTRFVVCTQSSKEIPDLHLLTLRIPLLALQYSNADIGLGSVRRSHMAFYKRALMGEAVCNERMYPGLTVGLALMICRFSDVKNNIFEKYPIFKDTDNEAARLFNKSPDGYC